MQGFKDFLVNNKLWWITPIVIFLVLLVYMAMKSSYMPSNPFDYRAN